MEIAGVKQFNQLEGKAIRVDCDNKEIYGIGHIVENNWYYYKEKENNANNKG